MEIRKSIFPRQKHVAATESNLEQIVSPSFKTTTIMSPTKTIERRKIAISQWIASTSRKCDQWFSIKLLSKFYSTNQFSGKIGAENLINMTNKYIQDISTLIKIIKKNLSSTHETSKIGFIE